MLRLLLLALTLGALAPARTILIVTADASDYILAAGGTLATMTGAGDTAILVRVTNDEKDSWQIGPEETARRVRQESEEAAKALGIGKVISLGYRAGELAGVSPTELRDRIMFFVRVHKPDVMFIPNPYAEYVEVLDRYYTGMAAEEARRVAALPNHQPPLAIAGVGVHITPELYYYAQPFDPRRREPESTATFVPQPVAKDIAPTLEKKIRAAQYLKTINFSLAHRIRQRLDETGRKLPLLERVDEASVNNLVAANVRGLAALCAKDTPYQAAEELHYAGRDYQVPAALRTK